MWIFWSCSQILVIFIRSSWIGQVNIPHFFNYCWLFDRTINFCWWADCSTKKSLKWNEREDFYTLHANMDILTTGLDIMECYTTNLWLWRARRYSDHWDIKLETGNILYLLWNCYPNFISSLFRVSKWMDSFCVEHPR